MKAIEIVCSSYEWWGDKFWKSSTPYRFDAQTIPDNQLPNAPVTVFLVTPDPLHAAQLLRLLAAKLEREPQLLAPLNEPGISPNNPAPVDDAQDGEIPF